MVSDRINKAQQVARTLLDDLEGAEVETEGILMKAKRLARLMRDGDAQVWLDYEMSGYPESFQSASLGTCEKYFRGCARVKADESFFVASLPELEAMAEGRLARADSLVSNKDQPLVVPDFVAQRATAQLMSARATAQVKARQAYNELHGRVTSIRSSIHNYATDVHISIELGDTAQDIFDTARVRVDNFVRSYAPKAAEQLIAINERMAENSSESYSQALATCRRLLLTVADALYPPRSDPHVDAKGKKRNVGPEAYKNRLLAHLEEKESSSGSLEITAADLEHLAKRLDAVYSKVSKGVHIDVTMEEARLAVIHTYLFLGEVARASA